MWYIVRDAISLKYVLKTKDLRAAVKLYDQRNADGQPCGIYGKPLHHNQLQQLDAERIAKARA